MNERTVRLAILIGAAALAAVQVMPMQKGTATTCGSGSMNLQQAISDQAQQTTLAFDGLGMITGNLQAQSFFPPGKLADYWGFQYLRDNDPSNMGHNTDFLTRVSCNMIYILNDDQFAQLATLASQQVDQINLYAYKRYTLMKAFRRLLDGDLPSEATGLDQSAVMAYSAQLYQLDGQICFDRAVLYANIFRSFTSDQISYLDAMVGVGYNSWPDKGTNDIQGKMSGLSQDEGVAVMTYAGDMFSWYAGCVAADIYFCPERHGTYYGGFYIKDAPAMGHPDYTISEQLTATAGAALCDSTQGYVTQDQAALFTGLVNTQRNNLYAGTSNIVQARTDISNALRSLIGPTPPTSDFLAQVQAAVLATSAEYGNLDGQDNYNYVTVFAHLNSSLSAAQVSALAALRHSILCGTYSDGTPFDFTVCTTYYLFSDPITDTSVLDPYISNTDFLFNELSAGFAFSPAAPTDATPVSFTATASGGTSPYTYAWTFDGTAASRQSVTETLSAGSHTVTLTITDSTGASATSTQTLTVARAVTITGVTKAANPFHLSVSGSDFEPSCTVKINGVAAPTTVYRSSALAVAKGTGLSALVPKGVSVEITVVNPDGSTSAPFSYTR